MGRLLAFRPGPTPTDALVPPHLPAGAQAAASAAFALAHSAAGLNLTPLTPAYVGWYMHVPPPQAAAPTCLCWRTAPPASS
jgi:hypothetical protein